MLAQADQVVQTGWRVLADFGMGAFFAVALLGSFLFAAWWTITVYLPRIEGERAETRKSFLEALEKQQRGFEASLGTIESRWGETTRAICERLDRLTSRVDVLDSRRHPTETWGRKSKKEGDE